MPPRRNGKAEKASSKELSTAPPSNASASSKQAAKKNPEPKVQEERTAGASDDTAQPSSPNKESTQRLKRPRSPAPEDSDGKPASRTKRGRSPTPNAATKKPRVVRPGFTNPPPAPLTIPTHPDAAVPADGKSEVLSLFIWGNGDMGQLGLGTDALEEIQRPRPHAWAEEQTREGKLGIHGLEQVAAGGLHTLALDSNGRVSNSNSQPSPSKFLADSCTVVAWDGYLDLDMGYQRQCCTWTQHHT